MQQANASKLSPIRCDLHQSSMKWLHRVIEFNRIELPTFIYTQCYFIVFIQEKKMPNGFFLRIPETFEFDGQAETFKIEIKRISCIIFIILFIMSSNQHRYNIKWSNANATKNHFIKKTLHQNFTGTRNNEWMNGTLNCALDVHQSNVFFMR